MRFGAPDNFWLLLLPPLLALCFVLALLARRRALRQFATAAMMERLVQGVSLARQRGKYVLLVFGAFFLVLALSAPQFGARLAMARRKGVDVVVALDVSRSMLAEDVKPNRLERAKLQIGALLDHLQGDRAGLVIFAGQAFVQCPLTLDYGALRLFLDTIDTGSVPVQGTAIGDAIRLARRSFEEGERKHKAIVLFTDGEDHVTAPLEAAEKAAAEGVRIFIMGMGTPGGELIPERGAGGVSYHKDARGRYVKTRLNEEALRQIALSTEGIYARSSLGGAEIDAIYDRIAHMDQKEFGSVRFTRYEERFQYPLFMALLCFFAEALLSERSRRRQEWRGRFA